MAQTNPVIAAAQNASDLAGQAATALQENGEKISDLDNGNADLYEMIGLNSKTIVAAQGAGELAYQKSMADFATNVHGDLDDTSGVMKHLTDTFNSARDEKAAALEDINEKRSVDLLDDPITWISNKLTINDDIRRYNKSLSVANEARDRIDSINKLISSRGQAEQYLKQTVTTQSVEAAANKAQESAQLAANEARKAGILANSTTVEKLVNMSEVQLHAASAIDNSQMAHQARAMELQRLDMEKQRFSMALDEKKATDAQLAYVAETVNKGYKNLYGADTPLANVAPSPKLLAMLSGKIPMDPQMKAAYESGQASSVTGQRQIATSAADLLTKLQFNPTLTPDQKNLTGMVTSIYEQLKSGRDQESLNFQRATAGKTDADREEAKRLFNVKVADTLKAQGAKITGPDNIFYVPGPEVIADKFKAIKNFTTYQKVIEPLAKAGVDLSEPRTVYKAVADAVAKGDVKLTEAASDLSAIYKAGQNLNIASKQFTALGISVPSTYNVSVPTTDSNYFQNQVVNLASAGEVARAMSKYLAQKDLGVKVPGMFQVPESAFDDRTQIKK